MLIVYNDEDVCRTRNPNPNFDITMRSSPRAMLSNFINRKLSKPNQLLNVGAAASSSAESSSNSNLMLLAIYFVAWYALNVGYNITNKQVLNVFPLYATTAVIQLLVAWIWLIPQWMIGIRPVPKPSEANMKALQKVSLLHGFGHLVTVLSMGLGAVSFVHGVKAMEPVFAAVLSAIFTGNIMAAPVYVSLLPVCAGVAIASAGELSFNWGCFGAAMMSNLLFASRAVFSKIAMSGKDQGENMDAANTFAVVTMLATIVCLPVALLLEGPKIQVGCSDIPSYPAPLTPDVSAGCVARRHNSEGDDGHQARDDHGAVGVVPLHLQRVCLQGTRSPARCGMSISR
jgi:hypothetical protein